MKRVLNKRILRDLRHNFVRYAALFLLVVLGMYIVTSMVASSENVIQGTIEKNGINRVEDGEFSVFVPLTDKQLDEIRSNDVEIEEIFNFDFSENGKVIRVTKVRENIDRIEIKEGRLPEADGEAVIEQRYAEENGISTGDEINISGKLLTVCGTGCVPDYDMPIRKISDTAVESSNFGIAFVTASMYDEFISGKSQKAQEYTYAYRLNGDYTADDLKNAIKDMEFDYHDVDDEYFQDYISDSLGKKDELLDGIQELVDGSAELRDGLADIKDHSSELTDGASDIFELYLDQANSAVSAFGITLTKDNYASELDKAIAATNSSELSALKERLGQLSEFLGGTKDYTDGVDEAYDGSEELADGMTELQDKTNEISEEYFDGQIDNLTMFLKAGDNPRINAASNERVVNKNMGLLAGVVVMILFMYVISVFVVHQIQSESSVIGALYALGIKKKDLITHYLRLPTIIALLGGIAGAAIGFSSFAVNSQMSQIYSYYSVPEYKNVYPVYLLIYCIVMPPVTAIIVNYIVINKKLSRTALSLIRNEQKESSISNIDLRKFSFIRSFQIRQLLRELRIAFTVVLGMFISMLIFMIGMNSLTLCLNVKNETQADTKYNYMYYMKYPEKELPAEGEAVYTETLSKEYQGYSLDVNIFGIGGSSKYFRAEPAKGKNKLAVSKSVQQKYSLSVGDKFVLTDSANDMDYAFTVDSIADYSAGLAVFMDIDSMRELFGREDDFYNTIFSDNKLDIEEGRLYSVTTKEDIDHSSEVFLSMMRPTQVMLLSVSVVIFFVVMYLMLKVMIDRASFGISLVKVFGYRMNEVRKLYINGYMFVVAIGALICIPLTKCIADKIYPNIISNTACGVNIRFPLYVYPLIFVGVMVIYFIIITLLVNRLKKISPTEVLKNRE
ncbi:ABC transporter permease [Ruminococcus flavefaciens]|uniref:ABC transporter permease n=1 Tax=Ruminococcus flavefaciens TaxID=1265 RepID=UPI00048CBF51|nr:ABC transporter permease [Ruminococcus flavefaciens]